MQIQRKIISFYRYFHHRGVYVIQMHMCSNVCKHTRVRVFVHKHTRVYV